MSLRESRFSSLMKRILFADSVIHGFIPVGRANHYMPSLKAGSIVKNDRFEVARLFDNFQVIVNTNLELSDVVGQIQYVLGSNLSKETTRVVIRLLIDPKCLSASPVPQTGIPGIRHSTFKPLRVGHSSQSIASNLLAYGIP
ncbi:hypothetical protein F2Q68_00026957 [Brassica cretica]|uniref:Uncharacterized protein n=2 Tax=Brassica cretica TaxID=69181 RepID=A0A8S9IAB2_BRACR|nr:hypothetical protein F2Q68_00026957 [Brassica cretica]